MARSPLTLLLPLLLAVGCATATAPPAAAPPAATTPPPATATVTPAPSGAGAVDPATLPDDVRWVATSAEYEAAVWQAFAFARLRLEQLAAGRAPGTWAVSVDTDETILGNIRHEIERVPAGGVFDPDEWTRWVDRREAVALPGAVQFLERVKALGGRVILVTNRTEEERAGTEDNLRAVGLPFDLVLPRTDGSDKNARWRAIADGTADPSLPPLEIVLWVGDNIRDFPGLDQSLRGAGEASLQPFGDRFVIVPNPLYGSWK